MEEQKKVIEFGTPEALNSVTPKGIKWAYKGLGIASAVFAAIVSTYPEIPEHLQVQIFKALSVSTLIVYIICQQFGWVVKKEGITAILLLIGGGLLLTSCGSYSARFDKLKYKCDQSKNAKEVPAGKCATWYPVKERIVSKIVVKRGDTVMQEVPGQTIYVDCDSAVRSTLDFASKKRIAVYAPATYNTVRIDTVFKVDSVIVENTARVAHLTELLRKKTSEADSYEIKFHTWRKWAIGGFCVAVLFIFLFIGGITGRLGKLF